MKFKNYASWLLLALLIGSWGFFYCHMTQYFKCTIKLQEQMSQVIAELQDVTKQTLQDSKIISETANNEQVVQSIPMPAVATTDTVEHSFKELEKKIFSTPQERRDFFTQLGVEYLNKHIIDYAPVLENDPRTSEKYLSDVENCDLLTKLYAADIAKQTLMPMSIRWIGEEIGHGVFAEEDLQKDGFVGIYGGEVRDRLLVEGKDYAWAYPGETLEGGRITLDGALKGNELRLINDGIDPNCIVKYIIGLDNLWHICYIAAKDIKKGEQLLISYGPAYWDTRKYKYQELAGL
jgi:hypothetical protein